MRLAILGFATFVTCVGCSDAGGGDSTASGGAGNAGSGSGGASSGGTAGSGASGGAGASGGSAGNAGSGWDYPGIPYPTDDLPAAIMPELPSSENQRSGWEYDPLSLITPAPSGAANEYVIATTGDDATAGNGGKGTFEAPRRTIPEGNFEAGTKIFAIGANSPYGNVDFDIGDDHAMTFECTASAPCWWVGIDAPRIGRHVSISGSSHLVMDSLSFVDVPNGDRPYGQLSLSDSTHITQRQLEFRGNGENSRGGSMMSISNVQFLLTYRSTFRDAGSWESNVTGLDVHGWRPLYGNRYLWLIESKLFHLQADGVQCGNSSNPNQQADSSHYVYVAGNEFYENYENALDNKNSYHVIFSSNAVHDFYAAPGASAANGTAVILSNNAEGPWTGYHWALNNRVWNTALAIRDSGSEAMERNFTLGNVIWNAETAFVQANNSDQRESWFIANTVHGSQTALDVFQPGSAASIFVRQNVFSSAGTLDTQGAVDSVLTGNVIFDTEIRGTWDVQSDNHVGDPLLADPSQGNMLPSSGGVGVGAGAEDPVFGLFQQLYGLDVRRDLLGSARPLGGWDIGAVEVP